MARDGRGMFRALRIANYRRYAIGALVSNIGTWMQRVAQDWLVLQLAGTGSALGIVSGLQFLPMVLLAPVGGVLADRFPKRRVLILTQSAMGLTAAALGVLSVAGWVATWHVYVLTFVFGIAAAVDSPTRNAFVNEMVDREHLSNAVGLNSASFNLARMIGPALAGLMIAALGSGASATGWVILLNAASYVAVLVSVLRIRTDQLVEQTSAPESGSRMSDGLRYVWARPDIMLVLAVMFFAGTFGFNFQITTALMATDVFGKGAGDFGILGSMLAVGSLAGSLLVARHHAIRQRLIVGSAILFGLTELAAGLMPTYWSFAMALPVCGLAALTLLTATTTFVQLASDAHVRGRVMAIYLAIFMGGTPIGAPLLGWVADRAGARWTLTGGGALTALGAIAATLVLGRRQVTVTPHLRPWPRLDVSARDALEVGEALSAK